MQEEEDIGAVAAIGVAAVGDGVAWVSDWERGYWSAPQSHRRITATVPDITVHTLTTTVIPLMVTPITATPTKGTVVVPLRVGGFRMATATASGGACGFVIENKKGPLEKRASSPFLVAHTATAPSPNPGTAHRTQVCFVLEPARGCGIVTPMFQ